MCKIGVHNLVCNGFAWALAPVLSTAGYVPPNSTVNTKPQLYLPSDPHSCPFDLSFNLYPASPPNTMHICTFTTVGANITIISLPPKLQIIAAKANTHLQTNERLKPCCINKTNPTTSGVMHASVGQKLVKSNNLNCFTSFYKFFFFD
jgi:hypothetical protein